MGLGPPVCLNCRVVMMSRRSAPWYGCDICGAQVVNDGRTNPIGCTTPSLLEQPKELREEIEANTAKLIQR